MSDLPMDILPQRTNNIKAVGSSMEKFLLMQSLERRPDNMQISISPQPIIALIAGISILIFPRLLNYIVAIYLIVFGTLGLIR
jgi:hypothetical protein